MYDALNRTDSMPCTYKTKSTKRTYSKQSSTSKSSSSTIFNESIDNNTGETLIPIDTYKTTHRSATLENNTD